MKTKNFIFAFATLAFLTISCTPQAIDEDTTDIQQTTDIEKKDIKIPSNG